MDTAALTGILRIGTTPAVPAAVELVIKQLENVAIAKYFVVASLTVLVYDWFLTITEEISLVWPSAMGVPKVLFFLNRYVALVDPVMLIYVMIYGSGFTGCVRGFQILGAFSAFGFITAQIILVMRTWAIWERRRSITILLAVMVVACIGVDLYVLVKYFSGISFIPSPSPALHGCLLGFKTRIVFIDFVLVMFTETVMLVLLVIKAMAHFRHSKSKLMVRMYRDGVIYFAFVLVTSIANVCTILLAPMELHNFLIVTQRVLHSILCSRVLLHIRGAYTNNGLIVTTEMDESRHGASFAFRIGHRPTTDLASAHSAVQLTSVDSSAKRYSETPYGESGIVGWGQGRGYDGGHVSFAGAFPVLDTDFIISPSRSTSAAQSPIDEEMNQRRIFDEGETTGDDKDKEEFEMVYVPRKLNKS